jgi:hypothetical protein
LRNHRAWAPFSWGLVAGSLMAEEFSWQPAVGNRGTLWSLVALVVVASSALAGFTLGNRFPLSSLVEAIESNGVQPQPAASHAMPANPSHILEFPIPGPQAPAPQAIVPVVLNPGAADSSSEPARTESPERATAKESAHPRAAQRDRRVLVVVRRVGAPHDTKVLRGRIQGGRLVVDQRDRRGIIIR